MSLRKKSTLYTLINIVSFIIIMAFVAMIAGKGLFNYIGEGCRYLYNSLFNRQFDFKTLVVILILLASFSLFGYIMFRTLSKDRIHGEDLIAPFAAIIAPTLVLAAIYGKKIGVYADKSKVLLIFAIIFLCLYVLSTIILLVDVIKNIMREKGIVFVGLFRTKKRFSIFDNGKMKGGKREK